MRVVIQRVGAASVAVAGRVSGVIGPGLLVLAGFPAGGEELWGRRIESLDDVTDSRALNHEWG